MYVAPIKALCAEKAAEWSEKFKELSVCLLTGDDDDIVFSSDAFAQASIIVTTPEKFDSMTRGHKGALEQSLIATVALLLIDEIHHLGDGRGSTLEAIISRILFTRDTLRSADSFLASSMPVSTLRILAVSATIPNLKQVARWLGLPQTSENCKSFGNEYRSVPLTYKVGCCLTFIQFFKTVSISSPFTAGSNASLNLYVQFHLGHRIHVAKQMEA